MYQLQILCTEFRVINGLIHFNSTHGGVYRTYSLAPDPQNFLNVLNCEDSVVCPCVDRGPASVLCGFSSYY
jgi:hypothetical protein